MHVKLYALIGAKRIIRKYLVISFAISTMFVSNCVAASLSVRETRQVKTLFGEFEAATQFETNRPSRWSSR